MAFEFRLPDIGEGVVEGEVVKWHVKAGETVREDQPMVEVMTDKATVEIPSPKAGTIREIRALEGKTCAVGAVMVVIDEGGVATKAVPTTAQEERQFADHKLPAAKPAPVAPVAHATPAATPAGGKVLATPATRKLARDLGVSLSSVSPSGPNGRVTHDDVRQAANGHAQLRPATLPTHAPIAVKAEVGDERIGFRGVRKKIAENMHRSRQTAAHFTYVEECDMTELVALRKRAKSRAEERGLKLSFLPFIVKAVCASLKKFPIVNSTLDEPKQEIVLRKRYHIGVAAASAEGLLVPVLRDADQRSLFDIARSLDEIGERAKNGKASREELTGSTFTISSLGALGGVLATPIINFPEVAVLGVHKIKQTPVVRDGQIVVREIMNLSISLDHRIVDGYEGAQFLQHVISLLEDPTLMFMEMVCFVVTVRGALPPLPADHPALGLFQILPEHGLPDPTCVPRLSAEEARRLYRGMVTIRVMDERLLAMQRQGRIGFYGEARGQEAAVIGAAAALGPNDWLVPALRDAGAAIFRGLTMRQYVAQIFGNANDLSKGKQLPCHPGARTAHYVTMSSCIATQIPHAVGMAWAAKLRHDPVVVLGCLGDGATSEEDFHVAANFAGVYQAPVVLFCANNQWAISTPCTRQTASATFAVKALAYGMPGIRVDGNDVLGVYSVVKEAVDRARRGGGPTLVEALTYRVSAHSSSDDPTRYRDERITEAWKQKDPIARYFRYLAAQGLIDEIADAALRSEIDAEVRDAIAAEEPVGAPPLRSLIEDVFAEVPRFLEEELAEIESLPRQKLGGVHA